jgi:uncharacterized protein involved in cysteine biosynthesis
MNDYLTQLQAVLQLVPHWLVVLWSIAALLVLLLVAIALLVRPVEPEGVALWDAKLAELVEQERRQ